MICKRRESIKGKGPLLCGKGPAGGTKFRKRFWAGRIKINTLAGKEQESGRARGPWEKKKSVLLKKI